MSCRKVRKYLIAFLMGELNAEKMYFVAEHVGQCRNCFEELNELQITKKLLQQLPQEQLSENFDNKVWSRIEEVKAKRKEKRFISIFKPALPSWQVRRLVLGFGIIILVMCIIGGGTIWWLKMFRRPIIVRAPRKPEVAVVPSVPEKETVERPSTRTQVTKEIAILPTLEEEHRPKIGLKPALMQIGKITHSWGEVRLLHAGKKQWVVAKKDLPFYVGDKLETEDVDHVAFKFGDGTELKIGYNTIMELQSVFQDAEYRGRPHKIYLCQGQIWAAVPKGSSKLEVETPAATARVEGTEFVLHTIERKEKEQLLVTPETLEIPKRPEYLRVRPRLETILTVIRGKVEFTNKYDTVIATTMTQTIATEDTPPIKPERVTELKILRFRLTWGVPRVKIWVTKELNTSDALEKLMFRRAFLGVKVRNVVPDEFAILGVPKGAYIFKVEPDSPAAEAGIQPGDVIVKVNDTEISSAEDFTKVLYTLKPYRKVNMDIVRKDIHKTFSAVTRSVPDVRGFIPPDISKNPHLIAADRLIAKQDFEAAEMEYKKAISANPNAAIAHNNLGVLYELDGKIVEAVREYQKAVRLEPYNELYHYNLGYALRQVGNLDKAVEELEAAVTRNPKFTDARFWLSNVYALIGDYDVALREAEILVKDVSEEPIGYYLKGQIFDVQQMFDDAEKWYSKAIEVDSSYFDAYRYLAIVYCDQHKLEEAERTALRAIALDPKCASIYNTLGFVYMEQGKKDESEKMLRKAIVLEPKNAHFYSNLGKLYELHGEIDRAEKVCLKAIQLDPRASLAYMGLALVYTEQKKSDRAEKMYLKILEIDPGYVDAFRHLLNLYTEQKKLRNIDKLYHKALENYLKDVRLYQAFGNAYREQKEWDKAIDSYQKTLEVIPDSPQTYVDIGKTYEMKGELEQAGDAYEKALKIDPGFAEAEQSLERIRTKSKVR